MKTKNLKEHQMDNSRILEALKMQPLTEEEKAKRHILGRLYGPIATSKEGTRNGRKYNAELWERQLNDDIFNEKIQNKALLLELGHPLDREETDMTKICACIPELPKTIDGDLYAYVDILDTPNGKILKTLVDYGFIPGISSRGSGDIMDNDEVDPETFFLETWDIVGVPAVKKARLAVCESLNQEQLKLRKALAESLNAANAEDKEIMAEALNNLKITLNEDADYETDEDVFYTADKEGNIERVKESIEEAAEETPAEETPEEIEETEVIGGEGPVDYTVNDLVKDLKDFDKDLVVEYAPVEIKGVEYTISNLNYAVNDDKLTINVDINPAEENDIEVEAEQGDADIVEIAAEEEAGEDSPVDEAIDNGARELLDSLKEMIRQKDDLEKEAKLFKESKAVSDAEVESLKEELNKYKTSFARVSEIASEAKEAKKNVQELTEKIKEKDNLIESLKTQRVNETKLTEAADLGKKQAKVLAEKLNAAENKLEAAEKKLTEQADKYKAEIVKRNKIALAYKQKFTEAVNKYIEMKASMLGVRPSDITNKLTENYTFEDIENVCDSLLENSHPTYSISRTSRAKIVESKQPGNKVTNTADDWDWDSLYDLAGLNK